MKIYEILQQLINTNCQHRDQIADQFDHWYNSEQSFLMWFDNVCYRVTITRENLFLSVIKFCLRIPRKAYKISVEIDN